MFLKISLGLITLRTFTAADSAWWTPTIRCLERFEWSPAGSLIPTFFSTSFFAFFLIIRQEDYRQQPYKCSLHSFRIPPLDGMLAHFMWTYQESRINLRMVLPNIKCKISLLWSVHHPCLLLMEVAAPARCGDRRSVPPSGATSSLSKYVHFSCTFDDDDDDAGMLPRIRAASEIHYCGTGCFGWARVRFVRPLQQHRC